MAESDRPRRRMLLPVAAWAVGAVSIIGAISAFAVRNPRGGAFYFLFGAAMIADGTAIRRAQSERAVSSETIETNGRSRRAWAFQSDASATRSLLIFQALFLAMIVWLLLLSRHAFARAIFALGAVEFSVVLIDTWQQRIPDRRASLALLPDGLLFRRYGRSVFVPWSAVDAVRASSRLAGASALRFRFSDSAVARATRRVRPVFPLIRSRRWHVYWSVLGTGVDGRRLAQVITLCAKDDERRNEVGTDQGLASLGLVGRPTDDTHRAE